jgi:peptide-methionine (S)-S-oxide reductase
VAKIIYDPSIVDYTQLLEYYWTHVDPTDDGGQFCDRGHSYKTAIFANDEQFDLAVTSKEILDSSGRLKRSVVTPVIKAPTFYKAEKKHQDYYKRNPVRYKYYRTGCRRDARIKKVWGKR